MCGIAGILSHAPSRSGRALLAMTDALRHRGPDGRGHVTLWPGRPCHGPVVDTPSPDAGVVFLGHRRLSIIDPQGTSQPLRNEDGSVWTVFNGEIYNYRELRTLLEKRGHTLREKGDTEVLVHMWEEFGEDMASHLNGMFALALYDVRKDILFLARDRFGEKPLYYWDGPDMFGFASELHALPLLDGFPEDRLDAEAMGRFFSLGYIPHPRTVYAAARSLSPGHVLTLRSRVARERAYWRPEVTGEAKRLDLDELSLRLDEAVSSRLVSDVPVGCFLSGGLDSSLVAAAMARIATPRTFTISTGDEAGDESAVARRIAGHIGSVHQEFLVEPDFVTIAERLARHYGQPFADYSAVPTYYVSKETRCHVKVALSGDGGDELFAGYDRYANSFAASVCGLAPLQLRRLLAQLACRGGDHRSHLADFILSAGPPFRKVDAPSSLFHAHWRSGTFQPVFLSEIGEPGFSGLGPLGRRYEEAVGGDVTSRLLETDQAIYLPADILTKVDIASMSVSLETRAPLLDHRLAEFVNRLASPLKLAGRMGKVPLRDLARRYLPGDVAGLPKRGFTLPLAEWMRGDIRDWCHAAVFDAADAWKPFLLPQAVSRLWSDHQAGRRDHSMRLWAIISVGLWHQGRKQSLLAKARGDAA